ncbi:hypothetical protein F0562_004567 [Nyssa sinensis]|uniref:CCT domain-containing protein n=1 Tax=Nyssa sinensis TaxID=561372 RepID=A0A5J5C2P1_9ASTE|nr:hypothetical protein F0562_004567 [Nyssa sinensis]
MCNKDTPSLQPSSMISKETTVVGRKTRTKTRKPKFVSLRLQLSPENSQQSSKTTTMPHRHHQLNLFPLHPENLVEDKDMTHDENVEYFFPAADGGATTLTSLLGATGTSSDEDSILLSPSLTYAYRGQASEEGELVRTAMRHKERDASEEKWVCYSEVVERKDEEVTSCAADLRYKIDQKQRLSLKLDYQEILNAWSDKGPLYIKVESPQTVPDLGDDFPAHDSPNGLMDDWGSNGGLWRVPEKSGRNGSSGNVKLEEEVKGGEEWKMGQREASVLRYKEKRQNRLFSKRIRYEVRKLNAEKRPRMKVILFFCI